MGVPSMPDAELHAYGSSLEAKGTTQHQCLLLLLYSCRSPSVVGRQGVCVTGCTLSSNQRRWVCQASQMPNCSVLRVWLVARGQGGTVLNPNLDQTLTPMTPPERAQ